MVTQEPGLTFIEVTAGKPCREAKAGSTYLEKRAENFNGIKNTEKNHVLRFNDRADLS